jgi:hypothetical protein
MHLYFPVSSLLDIIFKCWDIRTLHVVHNTTWNIPITTATRSDTRLGG